jgi:hypothetical protein
MLSAVLEHRQKADISAVPDGLQETGSPLDFSSEEFVGAAATVVVKDDANCFWRLRRRRNREYPSIQLVYAYT